MAGCTVYVLTGNNFRRFLWLPTLCSWTLTPDQPSVTLSTDSEWCLWGADTLALCAMSWVVARCPLLDTVLRSLLEPCHLSVSLEEPELALESLPWVAAATEAGFSESLQLTTTTADSLSLLNLWKYHRGVIDSPKTYSSQIIFQLIYYNKVYIHTCPGTELTWNRCWIRSCGILRFERTRSGAGAKAPFSLSDSFGTWTFLRKSAYNDPAPLWSNGWTTRCRYRRNSLNTRLFLAVKMGKHDFQNLRQQ